MTLRTKLLVGVVLLGLAGGGAVLVYRWVSQSSPSLSQRGTVSQQIAGTDVSIEYNRPVARGREPFGDIVAWGQMWNPGADRAALIRLSSDVQINGQPLVAGTYSIWAQPKEDAWTMIFSRKADRSNAVYPEGEDALRVAVTPRAGTHMETLAFYFPVVDGHAAELVLHWGRVVAPLQITAP